MNWRIKLNFLLRTAVNIAPVCSLLLFNSCSLLKPELFYADNDSCAPTLSPSASNSLTHIPLELHMDGIAGPVRFIHLFTEVDQGEVRIAGISPLLGREFVVSIAGDRVKIDGAPRFLSELEIREIAALTLLVHERLAATSARNDPRDLQCVIPCKPLNLSARCSNKIEFLGIEFYDKQLQAKYYFTARRTP